MAWTGFVTSMRMTDRLALRLALLLSVALLPLGALAILTSLDSRRTDIRSAERALVSLTADTETGRRALVESAFTTARTLARPTIERLDDLEACRALMVDTVKRAGAYSFVGFIETDGMMRCASDGDPQDFSDTNDFRRIMADPRPVVRRSESGAVSGQPVLVATQPVFDDGTLQGFISVVIALHSVGWLIPQRDSGGQVHPILFNRLGDILAAGDKEVDPTSLLPKGMPMAGLALGGSLVFRGRTEAGDRAVFAVAELVPRQLFVLGVWDPEARPAAALGPGGWPVLFPMMMWLASIGVVYFALDFLVIRHLRRLGHQMRRFALGDRTLPGPLPWGAPRELREVHVTFRKMAMLVARDEAELSTALAEKDAVLRERTVLLKEVHHRVKNNLQLIASIVNLQMRRLQDPRSRRVLQNVQDRVIGLAAIHRSLYQSDRLSELRADLLIDELLRHLFAVGTEGGSGIDLHSDTEPITLEADQLVPLSLLLTEAATNALKYVGQPADGGRPWIRVRLKAEGDSVVLELSNSLYPRPVTSSEEEETSSTRLGSELIDAFAVQLGARIEQGEREDAKGPCWQLRLEFPLNGRGEVYAPGSHPGQGAATKGTGPVVPLEIATQRGAGS